MMIRNKTSLEIEYAVADHFGYRKFVIVPNVTYGMGFNYELDMAILTSSGYLYEVEIKVSRADLVKDKDKRKWRYCENYKIRKLWFAIPIKLVPYIDHIPEFAGILVVTETGHVEEIRSAKVQNCKPLTIEKQFQFARLGTMRMWPMKHNLIQRIWNERENDK